MLAIIKIFWADGEYSGKHMIDWIKIKIGRLWEIGKRRETLKFINLPKRWIVERTFGWLNTILQTEKICEFGCLQNTDRDIHKFMQLAV